MIAIGTKVRATTSGDKSLHFFKKGEIVTRIVDPMKIEDEEFKAFQDESGKVQYLEESDYELL